MCMFVRKQKSVHVPGWRTGYKVLVRRHGPYYRSGDCWVTGRFYGGPIRTQNIVASALPTQHNEVGFHIFLNRSHAGEFIHLKDEVVVKVKFSGKCVYGTSWSNKDGVRAQKLRVPKEFVTPEKSS